jgi:hypothetical protein
MTAVSPAHPAGDHAVGRQDTADDPGQGRSPVIVLTYPHAGAARLRAMLAAHPDLGCTTGTGILPLCQQAADTWRAADGTGVHLSALAAASTRALATGIVTAMVARLGGRRWCEFAAAPPSAAETFLQLYPQTRLLCLHRAWTEVVHAAVHASSWGPSGPELAPFTAAHPDSAVTALTAYWLTRTEALIDFEHDHPDVSLRVRYEDLADSAEHAHVFAFLGLPLPAPGIAGRPDPDDGSQPSGARGHRDPFPARQVPAQLLARAHDLMTRLGYPPLASSD